MSFTRRSSFVPGLLATAALLAVSGFQMPVRNGAPIGETDGLAASVALPHIVLRTDYTNYAPGEVVIFTSSGWDPGESVTLLIREEPPIHPVRRIVGRADSFGEFFDNQFIAHWHEVPVAYYVTAVGGRSGRNAITTFGNTSVNLDQCANGSAGTVACTGGAWQNGNLNSNQANYLEGQSIPYRDVFSGVSAGVTYTKTISWDTTKSGKHAIDYLTDWNVNVAAGSDPCSGVLSPCPTRTTFAIPPDPSLTPANGFNGTQIAGSFQCYGCTITGLGPNPYSLSGSYSGDSSTSVTITFTATGPNAVIAWGGHVSTRRDWGAANSAVSISGSPYHMADIAFTCTPGHCSTGKQDRSVSAEAVVFPAKITVVKDTVPDSADDFSFTASGGLSPSSFMLDDDGDPTLSNIRVFSGITNFKSYSVTEVDPAPFSLTAVACTDDTTQAVVGSGDTATRTATIPLAEGQLVTCKFTNTAPPQCSTNADCSATSATPVCDPTSGKCVECLASSDCPAASPVCNTATHICGDCTTDTQCAAFSATPVCNEGTGSCVQCDANSHTLCTGPTPLCDVDLNGGTCVACVTNSDCNAANPVCDLATHTCGDCTNDTQCAGYAATPVCNEGSGSCVQCDANSHTLCTGATPLCDVDLNGGTCVACVTSSDCTAAAPVCVAATHTCGPCTGDADCLGFPGETACSAGGTCTECNGNEDCSGAKPLCDINLNGGVCVACVTNSDCTAGAPVCESATHTCGPCTGDADCLGFPGATACSAGGTCTECNGNEDCSGAKPLCDVNLNGGTCVACVTSADCTAANPVCDLATHICGDCTTDTQCAAYSATPVCNEGAGSCVQCDANSHTLCTGPTPLCDLDLNGGTCVACVTSADCNAENPVCELATHTCGDCTTDTDCVAFSATPVCNAGTGSCVACNGNDDCSGAQGLCDVNRGGVCVECLANSDCPTGAPICNSQGSCEGCKSDGDCTSPGAPACSSTGTCVQCNGNEDCSGPTPFCDVTGGVCGECVTNSNCTADAPVCNLADHTCSACTSDTDCALFPGALACSSTGTCVQCNGNEDCSGPTPFCDVTGGVCGECVTNSNCPATAPVCDLSNHTCGGCTDDADCAGLPDTPACSPGGSCVQCNSDDDCSIGEFCGPTGSCRTAPTEGKIAPTATTCDQYRLGTAADLTQVLYGVKGTKINNVAPGVLFYYTYLSDLSAGPNVIRVDQTEQLTSGGPLTPFFGVHQSQVTLYNASDCSTSNLRATIEVGSGQTVTINVSGATAGQDLIVGIKYNPSSVTGTTVGTVRPVVHYNFITALNNNTVQTDPDGLNLQPKP